jgi:multidrug resistance efflux pump
MVDDAEYIPVEEVAEILQVTTRQAHRHGEGENARLRKRKAGRRVMFNRTDVEALAADLGVLDRPRAQRPKTDLVPTGEMLDYIRERDRRLEEYQHQLIQAAAEIGRLQGQMEGQKRLAHEADNIKQMLDEVRAERDQLRAELAQRQSLWQRIFKKNT